MWFILGCGEHAVNTSQAKLDREYQKRKGGLESLAGPVAQWQSTRLITGGAQVRILPGPPFRGYAAMPDQFIAYVGNSDIHDATVVAVKQVGDLLAVTLGGADGRLFAVEFSGVASVEQKSVEGMRLYSLSEMELGRGRRHQEARSCRSESGCP